MAVPVETVLTRAIRDADHPIARTIALARLAMLRGVPHADEVTDALKEAQAAEDIHAAAGIAEGVDGPLGDAHGRGPDPLSCPR